MSNIIPLGVSQGDIVESGSNANGSYVKYRNGVMDCWGTGTATFSASTTSSVNITFPQTFAVVPSCNWTPTTHLGGLFYVYSAGANGTAGTGVTTTIASAVFLTQDTVARTGTISFAWRATGLWSSVSAVNKPTYTIGRGIIESGSGYVKYEDGTMECRGWTFVQGDGTNNIEDKAITFPQSFSSVDSMQVSCIGAKVGSDPTSIHDFSASTGVGANIQTSSTTGATLRAVATTALSATARYGLAWVVIGRWQSATVANGDYTYGQGVVETGSNSNGKYVKFDNGTMICTQVGSSGSAVAATGYGTTQYCAVVWTFPAQFVATPKVFGTALTDGAGAYGMAELSASNSGATLYLFRFYTASAVWNCQLQAIGRWK